MNKSSYSVLYYQNILSIQQQNLEFNFLINIINYVVIFSLNRETIS